MEPQKETLPSKRMLADQHNDLDSDEDEAPQFERKNRLAKPFACPFYKNNPIQYANTNCSGTGWPSVARIKEHLYRHHRKPVHCARCWMTFSNQEKLQTHQCNLNPGAIRVEGFDEVQERLLKSRKGLSKLNEVEKWRNIYLILFPDVPQDFAPNPYYENSKDHQPKALEGNSKHRELPLLALNAAEEEPDKSEIPHAQQVKRAVPHMIQEFYNAQTTETGELLKIEPNDEQCSWSGANNTYLDFTLLDSMLSPVSMFYPSLPPCWDKDANIPIKQELLGSTQDIKDYIPYSDSGYASSRGPINPSMHGGGTEKTGSTECSNAYTTSERVENDAKIPSSLSSMRWSKEATDDLVVYISNKIKKILEGVDKRALMSMSTSLPDLIKTFAVKIGSEVPDQLNLRIMHFVHLNHQYIATELQNEFQCGKHEPMGLEERIDEMPLSEIMMRWNKSHNKDAVAADPSKSFPGVKNMEDIEDDERGTSILSGYGERIAESAAWKWLVASLVEEASFHWLNAQPRTMIDQIRREIVAQLPTVQFASGRLSTLHTVSFRIPRSSLPFLFEGAATPSTLNTATTIADRIVATSSSDYSLQLSRVSEYMDQTWPLGGRILLSVVQSVINGTERARASSTLEDNAKIEIAIDAFYLEALVTGTSYAVAEYGEQLAWLTAALQPAVSDSAMYVKPFIRRAEDYDPTDMTRHKWVIELWRQWIDDSDMTADLAQEWLGGLKKPVIVRGFPTMSRPGDCPGIEVPPQLPASLFPRPIREGNGTRYLFTKTGKVLHMFGQTEGVTIWHILSSPGEDCTCRQRFLKTADKEPLSSPNLVHIWQGRHIITTCSTAKLYYKDKEPGLELKNGSLKIPQPGGSLSGGAQLSPSAGSTTEYSDSVDMDMLSIPDVSEDSVVGSQDSDNVASSIKAVMATRLISDYREYRKHQNTANECTSSTKQRSPGQQQSCTTQGSTQSTPGEGNFRASWIESTSKRRGGYGDRDSDDDDDSKQGPKRKKPKHHDLVKGLQIFACPFWKQNPGKHRDCFGKRLGMICRVKQHLARTHMLGIYCDRCLAVFPDLGHKRAHLRDEQCKFDDRKQLDGITSDQRNELSRKSNPLFTESEKWFAVWDIVFPDLGRPSSPYLDLELSQELSHFQEFSERRGTTLLIEVLRDQGVLVSRDEDNDVMVQSAVSRAMNAIFREWRLDRDRSSQNSASEGYFPRGAPGEQRHNGRRRARMPVLTDQSSNADSGVEVGSQPSSGPSREDVNLPPYASIRPRPPLDGRPHLESAGTASLNSQAACTPDIGANPLQVFVEPPLDNMAHFEHPYQSRENLRSLYL